MIHAWLLISNLESQISNHLIAETGFGEAVICSLNLSKAEQLKYLMLLQYNAFLMERQ